MNRYQKVLVCIFRSVGLIGLGYLIISIGTVALMTPYGLNFGPVMMLLPQVIPLLILLFAAAPLAKIVTIGVTDD
jgi:hypothetical protein